MASPLRAALEAAYEERYGVVVGAPLPLEEDAPVRRMIAEDKQADARSTIDIFERHLSLAFPSHAGVREAVEAGLKEYYVLDETEWQSALSVKGRGWGYIRETSQTSPRPSTPLRRRSPPSARRRGRRRRSALTVTATGPPVSAAPSSERSRGRWRGREYRARRSAPNWEQDPSQVPRALVCGCRSRPCPHETRGARPISSARERFRRLPKKVLRQESREHGRSRRHLW